ncbi:transposase [Streptomyces sp. 846.5]|nr:winged helix-turn-helix domain-containing protein [Streptomyces sp. 846.5]TDT94041.1 transposase [Streptomyces sp. 846.5]TDT97274.1 transposase [Streptomyces sp. 846.5]TDT98259.1 transposase [Streptomyces sp. 846.5]TDU05906.1 transposase [Streptomyces sp. 846.5]
MRYAAAGGYTPEEQARRERLRLEVAERFVVGESSAQIARDLRVTRRSVERWRAAWKQGGAQALCSAGPVARERLSGRQWEKVAALLDAGPGVCGFEDDQRWTLARVADLIGRTCHVSYTLTGVGKLLDRHGYSWQVPVRRSAARDEEEIARWREETWPAVESLPASSAPTSASPTSRGRG